MKVIIALNTPLLADKIQDYIVQCGHSISYQITEEDSLADFIDLNEPDVLISSFDDAGEYTRLEPYMDRFLPVIFIDTQENRDHYEFSSKFSVSRYIVYPFPMLSLKSILDELEDGVHHLYSHNYVKGRYIFVRHNNEFEKINIADIDYLYSEGNYTNIFVGNEKYVVKYSLSKLLALSNFDIMIRIHRNHAVQKLDIEKLNFSNRTLIARDTTFPFGRTYTKAIRRIMNLPSRD
ncbi:MAG: hypothetical protein HKN67_00280 [Saprospiraceae bacterium]|nr:hypothetical protein [Saprospiraceae bacterium]